MADNLKQMYEAKEDGVGWNVGAYAKLSIPVLGIFLEPQLIYTRYSFRL